MCMSVGLAITAASNSCLVHVLPRGYLRNPQVVRLLAEKAAQGNDFVREMLPDQAGVPLAYRTQPHDEYLGRHHWFQSFFVTFPVAGSSRETVLVPYAFVAATPTDSKAPRGNVSSSNTYCHR